MSTPVSNAANPFDYLNNQKVANSNSTQSSQSTQDAQSMELGQNQFLKLMLAQLKNQDPMKPQDPSAFLSQLAQFSTVTSVQKMQDTMTELSDSMRSSQVLSGASLVGHNILAPADTVAYTAGNSVVGEAEIPAGASAVVVGVRDSSGQLVRHFQIPTNSGTNQFSWDGTTDAGTNASSGKYKFEIVANVGGEGVSVDPLLASRVSSVTIDNNGLVLNTDAGAIDLADVKRVM
jgi:flagellar basal-body rod modification protein FlgD